MANGLLAKNGIIVTGSIEVQSAVTASAFSGDGSGLVGVSDFPYTGSAIISGSLEIDGAGNTLVFDTVDYNYLNTRIKLGYNNTGISLTTTNEIHFIGNNTSVLGIKGNFYAPEVRLKSSTLIGFSGANTNSALGVHFSRLDNNTIRVGTGGVWNASGSLLLTNITASGHVSASTYYGDGSNLTGISSDPFPYTGSAIISGSLILTGSIFAETTPGSQTLVIKSADASVNNNAKVGIGNTTNPASRNIAIGYINSPKYDSVQIGGRNVGGGIGGVTIGDSAASNNNRTGTIAIGQSSNRFSNGDIAIGNSSLYNDGPLGSIGTIAIGIKAGNTQSGTQNVILGTSAAQTSAGSNSIFIGYEAGRNNIGDNNVVLGHSAGYNVTGSNNVLLGYQAGYNLTGSNQLIIANNSSSALITGDFANNTLDISGSVSASTYYGDGSNLTNLPGGDPFPYTGSAVISGSLEINGSGSTLFEVNGSSGQLFSITDSLSGSLFAVSDVSGLPILEVFSDDTIKMGSFNAEALEISGSDVNFNNLPTSDPGVAGRLYQTGSDAIGATAGFQVVCISEG